MGALMPFEARDKRPLRILFCDLNAYFASVEQAEHPELRGKPVAVCPVMADSSFVIAASYEAKKHGVKTGTRIGDARVMCPEIRLIHATPRLYTHYHHKILDAVETVLPIDKVCSIDEMRFRLIGREQEPSEAEKLALRMKQAIWDLVSPAMHCSIGIAPNSFLAKLATDLQKPNGLVMIHAQELPDRLASVDLREFCGINRKMEARLQAHGIFTGADLIRADRRELVAAFGSIHGERWWYQLRGFEVEQAENERQSLGHSHVLAPDLRNDRGCREVILRLIQKATARLRANGLFAQTVSVHVSGIRRSWEARERVSATQDTLVVQEVFERLWVLRDFEQPRGVGITFGDLVEAKGVTLSLFDAPEERLELNRAVDSMNQKFGKNTIYLAGMQRTKDTADEKIAFNKTWLFSEGKNDNIWPDTFRGVPRPPRPDEDSLRIFAGDVLEATEPPETQGAQRDDHDRQHDD